jgi:transposase
MDATALITALLPATGRPMEVRHLAILPHGIVILLAGKEASAPCPGCLQPARRVASRYLRTIADLPLRELPVMLRLEVRRFFCDNAECQQKVFAEQFPELVRKRARTTIDHEKSLVRIGLICGGEQGARIAESIGLPTSGATILRRLRKVPPAERAEPTPTCIGIDDFAFRRGHIYGTVIVDHETGELWELLPERSSESTAAFLAGQPQVTVVTRDRSDLYAKGISEGRPEALQVADRFHIQTNLQGSVVRLLDRHHREITIACEAAALPAPELPAPELPAPELPAPELPAPELPAPALPTPVVSTPELPELALPVRACEPQPLAAPALPAHELSTPLQTVPSPGQSLIPASATPVCTEASAAAPARPLSKVAQKSMDARARQVAQYEQVIALRNNEQLSIREIRKRTGLNVRTIMKYLRAAGFPERARPHRRCAIDSFTEPLRAMWDAGEHDAGELHRKLGLIGFTGSLHMVVRCIAPWRRADKAESRSRPPAIRIASRRLSWLLLHDNIERKPGEQKVIDHLRQACEPVCKGIELARECREIFKQHDSAKLLEWIDRTKQDGVPVELKNFAKGLEQEWPSIKPAVELPWNNGRAEGHVNRIKLIKRQMYGRAKFDLLRIRVRARGP